jgi:membrane dipeptidase
MARCAATIPAPSQRRSHVRDVVGIDHVALGSDFDGAAAEPFDASQIVQVTNALLARLTADEVAKVMGGNLFRFLESQLPAHGR